MSDRDFPAGPSMLAAMRGLRPARGGNDLSGIPVFLADVARRYDGIAHWTIFGRHFFFLDDPALIEEALVTKARDYKKGRGIQRLKRLIGEGLLSSEDPLHLRRRRMLQPAFHKDRIDGYGRAMVALCADHIAPWRDETTLAIDAEMTRLTLAIAARTLLRTDLSDRGGIIAAALTTALEAFPGSISRFSELLDALPFLPVTRRFNRARAELDRVIYGIIAARRHERDASHDDLLAMLLAACDEHGTMDDVAVRDEAMTLLIAGHETTANALAWTWYLLARHPHVGRRLADELDTVLAGRLPDPADLPRLAFTHDVFAEVMRLYPPAWIVGRRAIRATTLADRPVPRGSVVLASQLVTQRNPKYWPDATAFLPERWGEGGVPARKFAYFPFGGGNRRCIGESFAWMEGVLLIATIAQRFTIEAIDDRVVDVEPLVTLRPHAAIRVRLRVRNPPVAAR